MAFTDMRTSASRREHWFVPRPTMDPCFRRQVYGRVRGMDETGPSWLERLFRGG